MVEIEETFAGSVSRVLFREGYPIRANLLGNRDLEPRILFRRVGPALASLFVRCSNSERNDDEMLR